MKDNAELSTKAILCIAAGFAFAGLVAYLSVAPIAPATLVALEHAAVQKTVTQ